MKLTKGIAIYAVIENSLFNLVRDDVGFNLQDENTLCCNDALVETVLEDAEDFSEETVDLMKAINEEIPVTSQTISIFIEKKDPDECEDYDY